MKESEKKKLNKLKIIRKKIYNLEIVQYSYIY